MDNIFNKEKLSLNLQIISLHIAVYESMVDYVVSNVRYFYCTGFYYEDEKYHDYIDDAYYGEVKNRIVDDKGNKDTTKASFLWLQDWGIIDQEDYSLFLKVKEIRNDYAHEMLQFIVDGVDESRIENFVKMVELYKKIANKWFLGVDASIMGVDLENADIDNIHSVNNEIFDIILNTLYLNKGKQTNNEI